MSIPGIVVEVMEALTVAQELCAYLRNSINPEAPERGDIRLIANSDARANQLASLLNETAARAHAALNKLEAEARRKTTVAVQASTLIQQFSKQRTWNMREWQKDLLSQTAWSFGCMVVLFATLFLGTYYVNNLKGQPQYDCRN